MVNRANEPFISSTTYTDTPLGRIGILRSGAFLYSHRSNPTTENNVAAHELNELSSLDYCYGHADTGCQYHYHKFPAQNDNAEKCDFNCDWNECKKIGFLFDGYPLYTHCHFPGSNKFLKSCYKIDPTSSCLKDGTLGDDTCDYKFVPGPDCHLDE
jgi:hypothetical protein